MKYRCGKCGKKGHNARGCSSKRKKKTPVRKSSVRRSTSTKGKGKCIVRGSGWLIFHYAGATSKGNPSNKTWAIKVSGTKVETRWGKSWGEKRETPKHFATPEAARAFANRKIQEKVNKGYYCLGRNR